MAGVGERVSALENRMIDVGHTLSSFHQTMAQQALLGAQILTALGEAARERAAMRADLQEVRQDVSELKRDVSELKKNVSELQTKVENLEKIVTEILSRIIEQGKIIRGFGEPKTE